MSTPGQPNEGSSPTLYGECASRINRGRVLIGRRALIAGAIAMPAAARAAGRAPDDPVERALSAMGGRALLSRVKALSWEGYFSWSAEPFPQSLDPNRGLDRPIGGPSLKIKTRIQPFGAAQSTVRELGARRTRIRVIDIDGDRATRTWTAFRETEPLPPQEAMHERQQFGLFGYMLLVHAETRASRAGLIAAHAGYPPIAFELDTKGRLASASYAVADSKRDVIIPQRIEFADWISDKGVAWPSRIVRFRNGVAHSSIGIRKFQVELN